MANDSVMSWIATLAFMGINDNSTITEEEYQKRLGILEEYKEEISKTRTIISSTPAFETWSYEKKVNFIVTSILNLRAKKIEDINNPDFSDCILTKEDQLKRVSEALKEIRQFDDCAKDPNEVEEEITFDDCALKK